MNILYITVALINEASGVYKKIISQSEAFRKMGNKCDILFISDEPDFTLISKEKKIKGNYKDEADKNYILDLINESDFLYIRIDLLKHKYFRLVIKAAKALGKPYILEIPTYPLVQESIARAREKFKSKNILGALKTGLGATYIKANEIVMVNSASLVTIVGSDYQYKKVKTIRMENGVNTQKIAKWQYIKKNDINIIAVSNFAVWNGFDRLLLGLSDYIYKNKKNGVKLIFVGDTRNATELISLTNHLNLQRYVEFVGEKSGVELDELFSNSDIAVCSLGNHRRKVLSNSSLKAKEYSARGIPFIITDLEGIEEEIKEQLFVIPSNDDPVDFLEIVKWYTSIQNKDNYGERMRRFARDNYSWEIQLTKVLNAFNATED